MKEMKLMMAQKMGLTSDIDPLFEEIPDEMVLSIEQIATLLKRSPETVRRWAREQKLKTYSWGGKYVIMGRDFKNYLRQGTIRKKMA